VRIGTWNLAGRWTPDHCDLVLRMDCDVVLLTEVSERLDVPGHHLHFGDQPMAPKRRWAGILSREPVSAMPDPHPASAMGRVGSWTYCSSILPWAGSGARPPWGDGPHAERTARAIDRLRANLPGESLIWGGDWNHAMEGREYAGSIGGRRSILEVVHALGLQVPTALLPHRIDGLLSIDHIAVPRGMEVTGVERVCAAVDDRRLSDHDAYVVSVPDPHGS
jgi:hypothetical protein